MVGWNGVLHVVCASCDIFELSDHVISDGPHNLFTVYFRFMYNERALLFC